MTPGDALPPRRSPLRDPSLRLGWARRRIEELDRARREFLAREPFKVVHERTPEGGEQWRVVESTPIPSGFSFATGEIIHTMRAVLDNLAWNLARRHHDPPPIDTEFVVARTLESFERRKGKLRGLPPAAAALIEELQPYNAAEKIERSTLWRLHRLANDDKHQSPTVVGGMAREQRIQAQDLAPHEEIVGPWLDLRSELQVGDIVMGLAAEDRRPTGKITYELSLDLRLRGTSGLHGSLSHTLTTTHDYIAQDVFPRFAELLEPTAGGAA